MTKRSAAATRMLDRKLTSFQVREIALRALVDPRTLQRALRGERLKVNSFERIRRALTDAGRSDLVPEDAR